METLENNPPDWAQDAIFYQIFPDRFANGDRKNDGPDAKPWGSPPNFFDREGGDLKGVLKHFDYLRDLGVNALYLNPIFAANSNHGYNTTDYERIDPHLGTGKTFQELVSKAHNARWRVLLDGVFNHVGTDFAPFQDVLREGERSRFKDWFTIRRFPIDPTNGDDPGYDYFRLSAAMPKLNKANPETRQFLLDVAARWVKTARIDGWRLDAADELGADFLRAFRKAIRTARPDAFIIGEIWPDAREWLQGDQFDSVTNYRLRGLALDFFANDASSPEDFNGQLAQLRDDYGPKATAVMFNLLGSHDTDRLRTACHDDRNRHHQAALFQMTYPGTPCIYYGDEIGMAGGTDPDNRKVMVWDSERQDGETLDFYRRIIGQRRKRAVLRRGDYRTVLIHNDFGLFAYLRTHGDQRALVVFNRSDEEREATVRLADIGDGPYSDWLGGKTACRRESEALTICLPARGCALLGAGR